METITFEGPFHFEEINKIEKLNNPGIYIWGFMYNKKNNEIIDPTDCNVGSNKNYDESKMQLIPYYVGIKKKSIKDRLIEHHNITKGDRTKYTRLSKEYMKEFYKTREFPINYKKSDGRLNRLIKLNTNSDEIKVVYFNNKNFLESTYPNIFNNIEKNEAIDFPINLFNGLKQKDTLKEIIIDKNNFWFFFANYDKKPGVSFESFETLTFHSLKGKTISKTGIFKNLKNNLKIIDNTTANIFNKDSNNNVSTLDFENIKEIPGY